MISHLKGIVEDTELISNHVAKLVLDVNSIGFELLTPSKLYNFWSNEKGLVVVFTKLISKETEQVLYGFDSKDDRDLFTTLLAISGIGPKTALSIISQFDSNTFIEIIIAENIQALSKVSGVGKKSAQTLITELKPKFEQKFASGINLVDSSKDKLFTSYDEVYDALKKLGYSADEIKLALAQAFKQNVNDKVDSLLSFCIKELTKI